MINAPFSNPNDFKVVHFTNRTDFDFTPEMGCMFDSRPIFGISGGNGIKSGESMTLPYHIGHRLAVNLAKAVMTRRAPITDPAGIPTGVPLWDATKLKSLQDTYVTDLYTDAKPIAETEVDRLMKKVAELNKLVQENIVQKPTMAPAQAATDTALKPAETGSLAEKPAYQDKQEVVAALEKKGAAFDARAPKEDLEKLLG